MDINKSSREPEEDESILDFFLGTEKTEGQGDSRCYSPKMDSMDSGGESTRALEAEERSSSPTPTSLDQSGDPHSTAYQETQHFSFDPFDYSENEMARSKMISHALQQEDEFLEYLMSLPISQKFSEVVDDKHEHCDLRLEHAGNIGSAMADSEDAAPHSMQTVSKVGLDHLDNLCKLMEQLGELRDQNSKLQRRVQYLEDLKSLHDMHKQLQESLASKRKQEGRHCKETNKQMLEESISLGLSTHRPSVEDNFQMGDSLLPVKRHASEESVLHYGSAGTGQASDAGARSSGKRRSHPRSRQSLHRRQYRERSRSVGHEEVSEAVREAIKNPKNVLPLHWQRQRRGHMKSKVSKWTKVKEAFRWEKAQLDVCRAEDGPLSSATTESKSQDSGIGMGKRLAAEERTYLDQGNNPPSCFHRVDSGKDGETTASQSDSLLENSSSHYHGFSYALSSSSSSSDDLMEIDLNFSGISEVIDIGPQRSASATDSTADKLAQQEAYNERRGRRSLSQGLEEDASRRSKSLDCEDVQRPYTAFTIDDKGGSISKKAHRTAWGKVKDIIQTRRDSVKKRQKEEGRREVEGRRELDADPEDDGDRSGCESADDCAGDALGWQYGRMEEPKLGDRDRLKGFRPASPPLQTSPRRLTPTLTVTLPSNEELSGASECGSGLAVEARQLLQGEPREARSRGHSTSDEPDQLHLQNAHRKKDSQFSQLGDGGTVENVGATSPPAPRRPSKWTKVKKAFLTARKEVEGAARGTINATSTESTHASVANSPSQCYQCQARRLADRSPVSYGLSLYLDGCSHSGINTNSKMLTSRERRDGVENATKTPPATAADSGGNAIERDIQKSYSEMQHNLGQEFHKKLSEWERMKGGWCTRQENKAEECEDLRKKVDEWQRTKDKAPGRCAPPTDDSHLPIDFRKRLSDWRRIRVAASGARTEALVERPRAVTAPRIAPRGCVVTDEESLPPQFRKRLVEWQLWRAVTGKSDQNVEELHKILPEEFYRKLQEWERIKGEAVVPVRVAGGRRYDRSEGRGEVGVVVRKDASALGRVVRRMRTNEVALGDKWSRQRNDVARESKHRGKEVQWLEKELQKVEREKLRLEREREKYLEREARLERMRRAMGQRPPGKQEVLIQTSTGFFRFQGISEKFTRKLYEWEKQRGIGPEASTFALLDPTYRPVASSAMAETGVGDTLDGLRSSACSSGTPLTAMPASLVALPRSRSEGSLAESGGPMHSRSSSLVGLEVTERDGSMDKDVPSRASSEPRMRSEARGILVADETEEEDEDEEETAALLVEVEDVEEETAAALEELPTLPSETPIYSYAPEEVTRLIDSSGSESDRDGRCNGDGHVHRTNSIRTQSSYELIEENMSLINKLKLKENICRKLENEIEDLEGKIQDIAKTHQEELERLRREETGLQGKSKEQSSLMEESGGNCAEGLLLSSHGEKVAQLKLRVNELERCKEQLKQEEKSLQTSFQVHSEQQEALAQNLVGKMKLLQEVSKVVSGKDKSMIEEEVGVTEMKNSLEKQLDPDLNDSHSIDIVQHLSTELLQLAEKLEVTLADRNQEIRNLRLELQDRKKICRPDYPENKSAVFHSGQRRNWSSAEGVHLSAEEILVPARETPMNKFPTAMVVRQSSEELSELPFLLTNKVLELKRELSNLCNSKGIRKESEPKITSQRKKLCRGKLQRIPNFQKEDEDYDPEITPEEFIPDRDNQASDKSKQEADSIISPSKPEEDEPMERITSQPTNTFYLTAFESVGRALEDVTNKCIDSFRTKPSAIEKEEERVRVPPSARNLPSSQGERKEEEKSYLEHKGEVDGEEARGSKKGTRSGIDDGSKVHPEVGVKTKEKHLKTRRISDTHVTYDSSKPYKNSRACVRDLPRNTALALVKDPRDTKGTAAKDIPKSPVETDKWIDTCTNSSSGDATDHPTPNVFVQTTRKIFSPVCGSSKGSDASSVVGYVVEYLEDGSEADEPGGMPPWRRRGGAMQPQEVTASRPCRPLGDTRKTTDTCNRTGIRSETPSSPSASSHPLPPPSPLSSRREKTKETAPSIRLMIAKYDLKQQQQQEGSNSGRSPEARSSGGRSPAWLSPTADRRDLFGMGGVKAQMEKYQEEVRKALVGYSNPEVTTVQKSASAGLIRSFGAGTCLKPPLHSIAKSSSVGTIKSRNQADDEPVECASGGRKMSPKEGLFGSDDKDEEDSSSPMNDSIENTLKMLRERHPSPPSSPSRSHKFAHVRAMRLKKAKEEFMKRTSVAGADLEDNSHSKFHSALRSANIQLKKEEEGGVGKEERMDCEKELCMRDGENECGSEKRGGAEEVVVGQKEEGKKKEYDIGSVLEKGAGGIRSDIVPSRHSQISFESESSYEDSAAVHQGLIKSASSGMIDIYSQKNKYDPLDKLTERENDDSIPSSNYNDCLASTSEAAESHRTTKVGIMSRFRKAKMRTKKMNVISALCRQSLLVSVDKECEKDVESVEKNQAGVDAGKQKVMSSVSYPVPSCRSCPSSPVPSSKKPENSGCWSHNPKHVFKPRRDREENVPKTNVRILLPHKKQI